MEYVAKREDKWKGLLNIQEVLQRLEREDVGNTNIQRAVSSQATGVCYNLQEQLLYLITLLYSDSSIYKQ